MTQTYSSYDIKNPNANTEARTPPQASQIGKQISPLLPAHTLKQATETTHLGTSLTNQFTPLTRMTSHLLSSHDDDALTKMRTTTNTMHSQTATKGSSMPQPLNKGHSTPG